MKILNDKIDALIVENSFCRKNLYDKNTQKKEAEKQLIAYAYSSSMANYYLENVLLPQLKMKFKTRDNSKLFKWIDLEDVRKLKDDCKYIIHDCKDEEFIGDIVVIVQEYKGSFLKHLNVIDKILDIVKIDINNGFVF
ncbi:hypothetical protein ACTFIY_011766 [Dictyostelium cf. discoideum]